MDISMDDLKGFVTVAELGTFHEAAHALNLSQSALTRRVQKLEQALGVQLLDRSTRRVSLSTVGRDFLPKARRLLDDFDASLMSVREIAGRTSGQVNIACVPTAAYYFLPEVIRAFNEVFPRIRVRILDEGANIVLRAVMEGEAELGINMLGLQEPDIEFDPLLEDPFVLACRNDHPLAKQEWIEWRELSPHRFIIAGRRSGNRLLMDLGLTGTSWQPKWLYEVQHLSTSLGLVEADLGVAALPRMAMPSGPHPILVSRPLVNPVLTRTMGIIRRRGATLSPAAQEFYNILRARWPNEKLRNFGPKSPLKLRRA